MGISTKSTIQPIEALPQTRNNYAKFLWHIGKVSKPDYTAYCKNLHALHQEYL